MIGGMHGWRERNQRRKPSVITLKQRGFRSGDETTGLDKGRDKGLDEGVEA